MRYFAARYFKARYFVANANLGGGTVDDGSITIFIRRHRAKPYNLFSR